MASQTELQRAAAQANWQKLQIKGAISNLRQAAKSFRIDSYNFDRCSNMLTKLEDMLIAQTTKDYIELKELITSKK